MPSFLASISTLASTKLVETSLPEATMEPLPALLCATAAVVAASMYFVVWPKVGGFAVFAPANAKGGCEVVPGKTAIVCIEYQNEFASEGGKLHPAVKGVMDSTDMLAKSFMICEKARAAGAQVIHAPIMFKADASDNPNKSLGILAGCAKDGLFTEHTWNSEFCPQMQPMPGDKIVEGKKGLDAFPNTNLEALLKGSETVVLMGFLTNCCVESTMRTACEKGFNVITITDGCATLSEEGHKAATTGTFGMFSTPLTAAEFVAKLNPAVRTTPSTASTM